MHEAFNHKDHKALVITKHWSTKHLITKH